MSRIVSRANLTRCLRSARSRCARGSLVANGRMLRARFFNLGCIRSFASLTKSNMLNSTGHACLGSQGFAVKTEESEKRRRRAPRSPARPCALNGQCTRCTPRAPSRDFKSIRDLKSIRVEWRVWQRQTMHARRAIRAW